MSNLKPIRTAVFDFDNTLFDTERIKNTFIGIVINARGTEDDGWHIYREAVTSEGTATFSIEHFFKVMRAELSLKGIEVPETKLDAVRDQIHAEAALLEGAEELLEMCGEDVDRYLLSLGVPEWQQEKVDLAEIGPYFPEGHIIYTEHVEGGKVAALKEQFGDDFSGEGVVVFNDKPDETKAMLEAFPELRAFLRRDERDLRYTEEQFVELEEAFRGRLVWGHELSEFHAEFRGLVTNEVRDGKRK